MKIQLSRERNNVFKIPDSFIRKNLVRIVTIYNNNMEISPSEYQFIGPREIKMNEIVSSDSKIYAKIMEIKQGNRFVSR